jgi:CHAT domain-containing protein
MGDVVIMRAFRALLLGALLALWSLPAQAQTGAIDPTLQEQADAGEPYAALQVAIAIHARSTEAAMAEAVPYLDVAEAGFVAMGHDGLLGLGHVNLMRGRVALDLNDYQTGLAYSGEAERIGRSIAENDRNADGAYLGALALEDQGILLQRLSRFEDSIKALLPARDYHASDPPDFAALASVLLNLGVGYEGLGLHDEALTAYMQSYDILSGLGPDYYVTTGYLCNNIAWIHLQAGNIADAAFYLDLALKLLEGKLDPLHPNVATVWINLGKLKMAEGDPDAAIRNAMRAMPFVVANHIQSLSHQRWVFEVMGQAFAAKGQTDRAILFGKMAVNAQQEIRATNTVTGAQDMAASQAEWRRLYQSLADLLIAQGRISEAQVVLNMEKEEEVFEFLRRDAGQSLTQTRALLTNAELTEEARLDALSQAPIAAERELRAILARIDSGEATTEEEDQAFLLQEALQSAADRFDAEVAAFLTEVPQDNRATLEQTFDAVGSYQAVLETLDRPTAILQVAAMDQATHLFLTLPGLTLHRQVDVPRAEVARLVLDALQAIEDVSPEAQDHLQALHQVVFAPVAGDLAEAGVQVVMLNLDGFLRYVPFAALHDGKGWLVERFAFAMYTPAVPTQFATTARDPGATAGFGVTAAHPGFSPLPGVAAELTAIFGDGGGVLDGETALDGGFDERSLRRSLLRKPQVLHIASHFNLLPGREDDSFLLLGDGSHLPLSKIRTTRALRFQGVDLLTLSACQTARGGDGSEIDGFAATAQLNGAGAVMASLWPVSDAATPILMRDFYAGLMEGGLDKAEALRAAQIAMLKGDGQGAGGTRAATALEPATAPQGFAHPYYWSAFVLMGNWL